MACLSFALSISIRQMVSRNIDYRLFWLSICVKIMREKVCKRFCADCRVGSAEIAASVGSFPSRGTLLKSGGFDLQREGDLMFDHGSSNESEIDHTRGHILRSLAL